ncbi:uncharacterized protein FOMMEDRAFT_16673 [Fomitiporia mediterranea MF3/22]|uniref:uncharacterized protein n=1 Tax=Fomitiporia mediterranea (strain MF3/22) TaxID=694068 RepID=UPI00044087C6|nr:uncharacterized protein FOMMEDRAFT_16673 [Fomitiporia mediterranea MF3/22]EJD08222.1 hypothetical protein FOMMEDRAFT_16673 [Fomitiporia mediterranea MF3/22]
MLPVCTTFRSHMHLQPYMLWRNQLYTIGSTQLHPSPHPNSSWTSTPRAKCLPKDKGKAYYNSIVPNLSNDSASKDSGRDSATKIRT